MPKNSVALGPSKNFIDNTNANNPEVEYIDTEIIKFKPYLVNKTQKKKPSGCPTEKLKTDMIAEKALAYKTSHDNVRVEFNPKPDQSDTEIDWFKKASNVEKNKITTTIEISSDYLFNRINEMEKRIEIKIKEEVDKKLDKIKLDDEISQLLTELHKRFLYSKDSLIDSYLGKQYGNILPDFYEQLKLERVIAECIYDHESAKSTEAKVKNSDTREQEIRRNLKSGNKRLDFKKSNEFCGLCRNANCLITEKISLYPDLLEYCCSKANISEIEYFNILCLKQQRNHDKHYIDFEKLPQLEQYYANLDVLDSNYFNEKGITKDLILKLIRLIKANRNTRISSNQF